MKIVFAQNEYVYREFHQFLIRLLETIEKV